MDRVYLPPSCLDGDRALVRGPERHHLAGVLRVRVGKRFLATDGEGREMLLVAERVERHRLEARILEERRRVPSLEHALTLAVAPPKGGRMDIAIEKAVECGVGRIVPLRTERSVVRASDESARADRWRRVAASATAQSGRFYMPEIAPVHTLREALREARQGTILLAHPGPEAPGVVRALDGAGRGCSVAIFVGPEGGFTEAECAEARRFGAVQVSLGPNRLRTETAAIVAVALVLASLRTGSLAGSPES